MMITQTFWHWEHIEDEEKLRNGNETSIKVYVSSILHCAFRQKEQKVT